jgi:GAF domain-containing protein
MIKKNIYKNAEKMINELIKSNNSTMLQGLIDMLYNIFDKYNWIGIYFIKDNFLFLGPWKGKQATNHVKIPIGKGICGSAAESGKTELINNVKDDNRYLACFINTKSEIVVPIKYQDRVIGEIDIDSDYENSFDEEDIKFLERIVKNQNFVNDIINYINSQK